MIFLVTVASPLLLGYLLVRFFLPAIKPTWLGVLLHLSLGAGCGMALLSLLHFLLLVSIGPSIPVFWTSEILLLSAVAGACYFRRDKRVLGDNRTSTVWGILLGLVLAIAIGAQFIRFSHMTEAAPHGQWDAWAIWNLRAAFLAQPSDAWRGAFSPRLSDLPGDFATHPDYPLLLSGYIARCWTLTGSLRDTVVPISVGALFSLATVGLLVSALTFLRSWTGGAIGGIILLSDATFTLNAPAQYADVPLSFFFLATAVLFLLAEADRERADRAMALAGFTTGAAAWTKDEGLLFAAVVVAAVAICAALTKLSLRRMLLFGAGAALPLAATSCFKVFLAPAEGSWKALTIASALGKIGEPARYSQIFAAFWTEARSMGTGVAHPAIFLALAFIAFGISRRSLESPMLRASLGIWGAMFAGYCFVYVVTPADLTWHLNTSLGRVLTQLIPGATFLFMAICRNAEEAGEQIPLKGQASAQPKKRTVKA